MLCYFNNDPLERYVCCSPDGCDGFEADNLPPHCKTAGVSPASLYQKDVVEAAVAKLKAAAGPAPLPAPGEPTLGLLSRKFRQKLDWPSVYISETHQQIEGHNSIDLNWLPEEKCAT